MNKILTHLLLLVTVCLTNVAHADDTIVPCGLYKWIDGKEGIQALRFEPGSFFVYNPGSFNEKRVKYRLREGRVFSEDGLELAVEEGLLVAVDFQMMGARFRQNGPVFSCK